MSHLIVVCGVPHTPFRPLVNEEAVVDEAGFFARLKQTAEPVFVDVWATWCLPCRAMAPALQALKAGYQGRVAVWPVNADETPELIKALRIYSIPTLIAFKGETEAWRWTGARSKTALEAGFRSLAAGERPNPGGLDLAERLWRIAGSVALLAIAWASGGSLIWLAAGGIVLFSAFHDRCPLWRALTRRWRRTYRVAGWSRSRCTAHDL